MGKSKREKTYPVLDQPDKSTLEKYEGRLFLLTLDDGGVVKGKIHSCGEHAVIMHVAGGDGVIAARGVFYQNIDAAQEQPVG